MHQLPGGQVPDMAFTHQLHQLRCGAVLSGSLNSTPNMRSGKLFGNCRARQLRELLGRLLPIQQRGDSVHRLPGRQLVRGRSECASRVWRRLVP